MDSTAYTLLLAMGAAICAAFISGWLLHMMVPGGLFWIVMLVNLVASPLGLFLPWYCPRQRDWAVVPTGNIFVAALLSIFVSSSVLFLDRLILNEVPTAQLMTDEFVRTLVAVCGIAMASSLVFFLLHYSLVQEAPELRRAGRRLRRVLWKAPKAKLMLCDDLAVCAPGECAICLEELASLEADLAVAPADVSKVQPCHGLLRFPCQHTFHGVCADRWMAQEVSCPMCRQSIGSLGRCVRFCLRPEAAGAQAAAKVEEGRQPTGDESPAQGEVESGEGPGGAAGAEAEGVLVGVSIELADAARGDQQLDDRTPTVDGESSSSVDSSEGATCKATACSGPTESSTGPVAIAAVTPTRQPRSPADESQEKFGALCEQEHQMVSI